LVCYRKIRAHVTTYISWQFEIIFNFVFDVPVILIICYYQKREYSQVTDIEQEARLDKFYQGYGVINENDADHICEQMQQAGKEFLLEQ